MVFREGIKVDPKKTEAERNYPRPLTPTDIISFLGLASYYRQFMQDFSTISSLLTNESIFQTHFWDILQRNIILSVLLFSISN